MLDTTFLLRGSSSCSLHFALLKSEELGRFIIWIPQEIHDISNRFVRPWEIMAMKTTKMLLGNLPKVDSLVMSVLSTTHISMITNDFSYMFWGHFFFLSIHIPKLSFFSKSFGLKLLPFLCWKFKKAWVRLEEGMRPNDELKLLCKRMILLKYQLMWSPQMWRPLRGQRNCWNRPLADNEQIILIE